MNLVFCKEKISLPKYAIGIRPYTIDVPKIIAKINSQINGSVNETFVYLLNSQLSEDFNYGWKKGKTCIVYINPEINLALIKNIKKSLKSMEIEVKKYFLADNGEHEKLHKHVDRVIKLR